MSDDSYWKAMIFAVLAALAMIAGSPAPAVFSGLICIVTALDGVAKALVATVKAPAVSGSAGRDTGMSDSKAPLVREDRRTYRDELPPVLPPVPRPVMSFGPLDA